MLKVQELFVVFSAITLDLDSGGLECSFVQRHGSNFTGCGSLLCGPHDVWELRPLQPVGGHPGGGVSGRGIDTSF